MSELAETIERVVREVLAKMGHTVAAAAPQPKDDFPAVQRTPHAPREGIRRAGRDECASRPASGPQENGDRLVLDRRVVTLADLPERIKAVRRVIVPPGAVITPAVRDELQRRRITLVFGEPNGAAAKAANTILMVAAAKYDPAPLAAALEREGHAVELRRAGCLIRATDELAADLKSSSMMAVLITAHPAPAVCLANRHAGVRAILGTRADTVAGDAAGVGANVLVADPAATGFFALKQMASRFLRGGPRQCPEVFQKRLA